MLGDVDFGTSFAWGLARGGFAWGCEAGDPLDNLRVNTIKTWAITGLGEMGRAVFEATYL